MRRSTLCSSALVVVIGLCAPADAGAKTSPSPGREAASPALATGPLFLTRTGSFPIRSRASFNTGLGIRATTTDPATGHTSIWETAVSGQGPAVTISYDPLHDTYTLKDSTVAASFPPALRSAAGYFNVYTKPGSGTLDQLELFNNSATSAPIKLRYLSFGSWSHTNLVSGDKTDYYFLYGFPTAGASMPRTGSANYATFVTGSSVRTGAGAGNWQVGGNASFAANFANGTVTTDLSLARLDPSGNIPIGSFAGTASISASQFIGNFNSTAPGYYSGFFAGGFYGPGAAEMGYNFGITLLQSDPYACAALPCAFQESIVGTVVGAKK